MSRYRLPLRTLDEKAYAKAKIDNAPAGWSVEFRPPTRTLPQNSHLWATLDDISAQVEWFGEKLTSEEWKDICTAALKKQRVVPGIDGGVVVIGAHTSQMTVEELSDLIELARAFGSERGVKWGDDDSDQLAGGSSSPPAGERASEDQSAGAQRGNSFARDSSEDGE